MTQPLAENSPALTQLLEWWEALQKDRGIRATLRRCKTPEAVMFHPAYLRLRYELKEHLEDQWNWEQRLACVVGVMAHVEKSSDKKLAVQMGGREPIVSELRFRRLLQCNHRQLYPRAIRVLKMLKQQASLADLASSIFFWGDRTKREWAMQYFAITPDKNQS